MRNNSTAFTKLITVLTLEQVTNLPSTGDAFWHWVSSIVFFDRPQETMRASIILAKEQNVLNICMILISAYAC